MNMNVSPVSAHRSAGYSRALSAHVTRADLRGPISEPIVSGLVALGDGVSVLGTGILAAWSVGVNIAHAGHLACAVSLLGVFMTSAFWWLVKAYGFAALTKALQGIGIAVAGLGLMIVFQIALTVATAGVYRTNIRWMLTWFFLCAPLLIMSRVVLRGLIGRWGGSGRLSERIAVVGATSLARQLVEGMRAAVAGGGQYVRIVGIFDDLGQSGTAPDGKSARCIDDLIELIRNDRVDAVVLAIPFSDKARMNRIIERLKHTPVDVRICPDYAALARQRVTIRTFGQYAMLNVMERPLCHWKRVAKDIEDRVLGTVILLMIAPLMGMIAFLIKLDSPGPVLFRQKRLGYNNKLIEVLKFRTMHHAMSDPNADQLTKRNDPRVTRLGAFLRRTSLDELPQFINVVRGDMSIVGPRPHALAAKAGSVVYHEAVAYYDARHRMKPGITGWAQVNGWRGETETVEQLVHRVDHDLFYVENWSVLMDLKIIVRTIFCGFTGKSAY